MFEVLVTMAVIGAISVAVTPSLIAYWRSATTKAAAQELAAGLNQARHLAIAQNQSVCVQVQGGRYRYRLTNCAGTIWLGPATTGDDGFVRLTNSVTITSNANPVFDYLGAAAPAATFTVTNPAGGQTRTVVVSVSGRVQVP
jgi:Tfp pilus assembly protein FimT